MLLVPDGSVVVSPGVLSVAAAAAAVPLSAAAAVPLPAAAAVPLLAAGVIPLPLTAAPSMRSGSRSRLPEKCSPLASSSRQGVEAAGSCMGPHTSGASHSCRDCMSLFDNTTLTSTLPAEACTVAAAAVASISSARAALLAHTNRRKGRVSGATRTCTASPGDSPPSARTAAAHCLVMWPCPVDSSTLMVVSKVDPSSRIITQSADPAATSQCCRMPRGIRSEAPLAAVSITGGSVNHPGAAAATAASAAAAARAAAMSAGSAAPSAPA
mmetsp:Transcript_18404/g.55438  ORF Transcript_18404/g.55438 Transcript_18404/m.55438 type:complete len:269 (+) Transcript_18404:7730-8536(+)